MTPANYRKLDEEAQWDYLPVYKKYRITFTEDYDQCYECGHSEFTGYRSNIVGVGRPYKYVYRPLGPLGRLARQLIGRTIAAETKVTFNKFDGGSKTISFTRYKPL